MKGLLLINLGTPTTPGVQGVRSYLREFLADKRVINLPLIVRYFILYAFILPFRPQKTSKAYRAIWKSTGSPLLENSELLLEKLQTLLGEDYKVALGMRYGKPSLENAIENLSDCSQIILLPLYPQFSSAATGSSIEFCLQKIAQQPTHPHLKVIRDFFQHPGFIEAQSDLIKPVLPEHDYLLFSYHGLPENHLKDSGCIKVCEKECPNVQGFNQTCYRAQCYATTHAIAHQLNLASTMYSSSFQSRLGRTPWIKPYTDIVLTELIQKGIKRLAVACPSFTADCLETLEEIGIQAKEQWRQLGGEYLTLIPCVNYSERWVKAIVEITES